MKKSMYEIFKRVSEVKKPADRVTSLRLSCNPAMQAFLKYTFDPNIEFLLPEGEPPYKPAKFDDLEGRLFTEVRRMYLFIKNGNPNLSQNRREMMYIQLLESVDRDDAKLLLAMKEKKTPFKTITCKLVNEAFPGLLTQKELEKA